MSNEYYTKSNRIVRLESLDKRMTFMLLSTATPKLSIDDIILIRTEHLSLSPGETEIRNSFCSNGVAQKRSVSLTIGASKEATNMTTQNFFLTVRYQIHHVMTISSIEWRSGRCWRL